MKTAVFLLCLLPLVFAAPEKRFIFDDLSALFSTDQLVKDLQVMLDTIGSDATEQVCETECAKVVHNDVVATGCPLLCHSFQALVHKYNLTPDVTTAASV